MPKKLKIALDFDGTCVKYEYPEIGEDIGAIQHLKELTGKGHKIILFTMRDGDDLKNAIRWFKENDIPLYSIQKDRGQYNWTKSPKCNADVYIDDKALGCPLVKPKNERPYVDWEQVMKLISEIE